jgi:ssDNA-binding Zn-finger/Zn-ribbon topoisomerase 1
MSPPTQHHLLFSADAASSVYECSSCGERFLGEKRCPDCNLFSRNLGLGGTCPECDQIVLLSELLGLSVNTTT